MKVAGTSIESALWQSCNSQTDIYTGALLKSEILSSKYDLSPVNNWSENKVLNREDAILYLRKNSQYDLIKKIKEDISIHKIRLADPIVYEHTSPKMLAESNIIDISNYKTISIIRNPFDMIVSYYWWAFNVGDTYYDSFNERYKKNKRNISSLSPKKDDTVIEIREKIKKFYNMPANFSQSYRRKNKNQTVIEWIAEWQNEFFLYNMDLWIKFEDLHSSYADTCEKLSIEKFNIPKFKTGLRKNKIKPIHYYDSEFYENVICLFRETLDKFNYNY
tara:strand:- start:5387 stop:6214 length:828 start_codon:yes stop_codon:yes gene_type:complete